MMTLTTPPFGIDHNWVSLFVMRLRSMLHCCFKGDVYTIWINASLTITYVTRVGKYWRMICEKKEQKQVESEVEEGKKFKYFYVKHWRWPHDDGRRRSDAFFFLCSDEEMGKHHDRPSRLHATYLTTCFPGPDYHSRRAETKNQFRNRDVFAYGAVLAELFINIAIRFMMIDMCARLARHDFFADIDSGRLKVNLFVRLLTDRQHWWRSVLLAISHFFRLNHISLVLLRCGANAMRRHGDDELEIGRVRAWFISFKWTADASMAITITDFIHFRCAIIMRAAT